MPKILLVDDSGPNLRMLSRRLSREGFEMIQAIDGQEAIDVAQATHPDLILMDLSLPVLDGWEATRRLKSDPMTSGIPIIALTAHALAGEREKALEARCDEYDTKPVDLPRLLSKIDALLKNADAPIEAAVHANADATVSAAQVTAGEQAAAEQPAVCAGRVLVVDDVAPNRDLLCRRLRLEGFEAVAASSGEQALRMLETEEFDVVLLDVMMPKVSGHDVLLAIRATLSPADLPVIMATARTQSDEVVHALKLGASDYVTKPFDFPIVLARVHTQAKLRRAMRQVVRLEAGFRQQNERLGIAYAAMHSDLRAAARVQMALLPQAAPVAQGLGFAWLFKPTAQLAGDIFNIFRLDEHHVGFHMVDVSGHGVAAALLAVTVSHFLSPVMSVSSLLWEADSAGGLRPSPPVKVARQLVERFPFDETTRQYFTLLYGLLDLRTLELRYVVAGHPGLLRLLPHQPPQRVYSASSPIGVPASVIKKPHEERSIQLIAGERLYVYSDGVVEHRNAAGEPYGLSRLSERMLAQGDVPLQQGLDALWDELQHWSQPDAANDDISIMAIEREA